MGRLYVQAVAVLLAIPFALCAAPPEVPAKLTAKPGQLVRVVVKADEGKLGHTRTFTDAEAFWGELVGPKGTRAFVFQAPSDGKRAEYVVAWWTKGETDGATTTITIEGAAPTPGPNPPGPGPQPDPPTPGPVTSFRVFLIYESGDSLTSAQRGVMFGGTVEAWLNENCTGGKTGWRRRDKDAPGESDPTMSALWAAVQPKVTVTPCLAVEVNGKAEIVPLPASQADAVALLKKYAGK